MKISLPLKLGIFVVLLFAAVTAACLLWTPLRIRYHLGKFHSSDAKERVKGVNGLLAMGEKGKKLLLKNFPDGEKGMEFLIKYWKDFDKEVEEYGRDFKPLHVAAEYGYAEVVALFIAKGANVNAETDWRERPLHIAATYGSDEVAKILIEAGAELNEKNKSNGTPLYIAFQNYNYRIAKMLHERGGRKYNDPSWTKYEKIPWPEGDIKEQLEILRSKKTEKEICYKLKTTETTVNFVGNSFIAAIEHVGDILEIKTRIPEKVITEYNLKKNPVYMRLGRIKAKNTLNLLLGERRRNWGEEGTGLIWRIEGNEIVIDVPKE